MTNNTQQARNILDDNGSNLNADAISRQDSVWTHSCWLRCLKQAYGGQK